MKMLKVSIVVLIGLLLLFSVVRTWIPMSDIMVSKDYLAFVLAALAVTIGLGIGNCWMLFVRKMTMGWVFWLTNFWAVAAVQVLLAIPLFLLIKKM